VERLVRMNKPTKIIIHHSAVDDGKIGSSFDAVKKYHIEQMKMRTIAYHYFGEYINDIFSFRKGRKESEEGGHCRGMNNKSIGVCVHGNFDKTVPNEDQLNALATLCADICKRYHLRPDDIEPHHKYASYKTCPGSKFPMDKLRAKVRAIMDGGRL
jgi:N-acetylmuramoyl-L-alanine amidase